VQIRESRAGARRGYARLLWLLIALGVAVRVGLAFGTRGSVFDLGSYVLVKQALRTDPLHVYALVNTSRAYRWPYPPAYFPVIAAVGVIAKGSGLAFTSLIRVPAIAADAAIAWVVQDFLATRGVPERTRLAAAGTVALGPLFVPVSGYLGGFDSVAILPAVVAVSAWHRLEPDDRALVAGALIGLGGALKTVPLLMVFALLPSCRSRREAVVLVASAAAVPAIALAPLLAADAHGVLHALSWQSLPGVGGLSLLAQPDLARVWLVSSPVHVQLSGLSHALQGHLGQVILGVPLGAAALMVARLRSAPVEAASLLWLTVFACSVNFGPRYAVWGLAFFVMTGRVGGALIVQVLLSVPNALLYLAPFPSSDVLWAYVPPMLAAGAAFLASAAIAARRAVHGREPKRRGRLAAAGAVKPRLRGRGEA
jgi:hypothetical protein